MSREDFKVVPDVGIDQIQLDVHNARIRAGHDQADCVNRILRKEDQLVTLARNIAEKGLTTMPILVSPGGNPGTFVVRDGNRRVTALKLLNDPARWAPDGRVRARFQAIASEFATRIPKRIEVLLSENEQAIIDEILARHSGAAEGAGQLNWEPFMRTVFQVSNGLPAEYKRPGQYALWAEDHDIEVPDEFPITSLQRFFSRENLAQLGFDIGPDDEIVPNLPLDGLKKMVATVCGDFATGRKQVKDVFEPEQAAAYIASVRQMHGVAPPPAPTPSPTTAPTPAPGGGGPAPSPAPGPTSAPPSPSPAPPAATPRPAPTPQQAPSDRSKIFGPRSPGVGIPQSERKAAAIVVELRNLDMNKNPIAAAMLLRALIEISNEHYREVNDLPTQTLARSVKRSADHMQGRGMLTAPEHDIIHRLCDTTGSLIQIESLQKMVHRDTHHLDKQFVNTFWDNVSTFVKACWRE